MHPLQTILEVFGGGDLTEKRETLHAATFEGQIPKLRVPECDVLLGSLNQLPGTDSFELSIQIGDGEGLFLRAREESKITDFLADLQDQLEVLGTSVATLFRLRISKRVQGGSVAVYFPAQFFQSLIDGSVRDTITQFDQLLRVHERIEFLTFEPINRFATRTIEFRPVGTASVIISDRPNRTEILSSRAEIAHFADASVCNAIPDDFRIVDGEPEIEIRKLFDRVCLLLAITFVADISRFAGTEGVAYKLKGYKTFEGETDAIQFRPEVLDDYFRIYRWIYGGGPASDKAGLARNLLSLHIIGDNLLHLKAGAYGSVCSGYDLYLKQNVKQYLEVKNKLVDHLTSTGREMAKSVQSLGESLRTNFLAFASFFITAVVIRVATTKELAGAFPPALVTVAIILLAGSLVHLLASLKLLDKDEARLESSYNNLPRRYSDLLSSVDLDGIINANREEFDQVKTYVGDKRKIFTWWWVAHVAIFGLLVGVLSSGWNVAALRGRGDLPLSQDHSVSKSPPSAGKVFDSSSQTPPPAERIPSTSPAPSSRPVQVPSLPD